MKDRSPSSRTYGHKAQCGIRMIKEALMELEACRSRYGHEREILTRAAERLAGLNLLINCIVIGDERKTFDT